MDLNPTLLPIFICLLVALHAIGQGATVWVFLSEIYPNRVLAYGQSWSTSTHWVLAAIIALITPLFIDKDYGIMRDNLWNIYYFFAAMMVL